MHRLPVLILVMILAAACQPAESARVYPAGDKAASVDNSLITDQPCGPPCLYGLVPGQTTHDEALKTLADNPRVRNAEVITQDNRVAWQSTLTDWGSGDAFFSSDGTILAIRYSLEYPLHLQDMIAARGDPDGIAVDHAPCAECTQLCYKVLWRKIGVEFQLCRDYDNYMAVEPKPDDLIDTVTYSAPAAVTDEYFHQNGYCPWKGYKSPLAKGRNMDGTPAPDAIGCAAP